MLSYVMSGVPLLARPELGAEPTASALRPGQRFFVDQKVVDAEDGVTFVRPRNEHGFAADRHPGARGTLLLIV